MNIPNTIFTISLSDVQLDKLSASSGRINKMQCLFSLIRQATTSSYEYKKKGLATALHVGQTALSEVELADIWHCNRKTASKVIDEFNRLGLISSVQGNRTSIHSMLCIESFHVDGVAIPNPFHKEQTSKAGN